MAVYNYKEIVSNPDNFIKKHTDYGRSVTDAPYEFHEAYAISMLGIASHGLLYYSANNPRGQALNTYFLMHGGSAIARKSTCMRMSMAILDDALKGAFGQSNDFTPEGLMDVLQRKDGLPMVVYMDEFTTMLDRLMKQSMSGLKPLILKFLNDRYHVYTRTSKGALKKKEADEVIIKNGHLNIAGNITPTITQRIMDTDAEDGFLGRFLIIAPRGKPDPMRNAAPTKKQLQDRMDVIMHLSEVAQACQNCMKHAASVNGPTILIDRDADDLFWKFQQEIEAKEGKKILTPTQFIVIQRIPDYSIKLACLISLGEYELTNLTSGPLIVTKKDAELGIKLARKYMKFAIDFAKDIGSTQLDHTNRRIVDYIAAQPDCIISKRVICRNMNIDSRAAKDIESTLILQGKIEAIPIKVGGSPKATIHWSLLNGTKPAAPSPSPMEDTKGLSDEATGT